MTCILQLLYFVFSLFLLLIDNSVYILLVFYSSINKFYCLVDPDEADCGEEAERGAGQAARHAQGLRAAQEHCGQAEAARRHHSAGRAPMATVFFWIYELLLNYSCGSALETH